MLPPSIWIVLILALLFGLTLVFVGQRISRIFLGESSSLDESGERLSTSWGIALALGSATTAWTSGMLTFIVIPKPATEIGWILVQSAILLIVMVLGLSQVRRLRGSCFRKWSFESVFLFLCIFAIAIQILSATQIPPHGDGYVAYLRGPRIAFEEGSWKAVRNSSVTYLASTWENTWSWIHFLFPDSQLQSLAAAQVFAQLITAALGYCGIALLTHSLLSTWFAAFAALTVPGLIWLGHLSKNDMGVSFWALAATGLLLQGCKESQNSSVHSNVHRVFLFGGILAGLAVAGKPTVGVFFVALGITLALDLARRGEAKSRLPRFLFWGALGSVIGLLPFLLRNFYATGNPIFPWAEQIFQTGFVSPSAMSAATEPLRTGFLQWIVYLREYVSENPLIVSVPMLFVLSRLRWIQLRPHRILGAVLLLSTALYTLLVRPQTELRYHLPTLFLWAAWVAQLLASVRWQGKLSRLQPFWIGGITMLLLSQSQIPAHRIVKLFQGRLSTDLESIEHLRGGKAKKWLVQEYARLGMGEGKLLVIGDNQAYYLSPLKPRLTTDEPALESKLITIWSGATADDSQIALHATLDLLLTNSIDFLYLDRSAPPFLAGNYFPRIRELAEKSLPERCLLYSDETSLVLNLACWRS